MMDTHDYKLVLAKDNEYPIVTIYKDFQSNEYHAVMDKNKLIFSDINAVKSFIRVIFGDGIKFSIELYRSKEFILLRNIDIYQRDGVGSQILQDILVVFDNVK